MLVDLIRTTINPANLLEAIIYYGDWPLGLVVFRKGSKQLWKISIGCWLLQLSSQAQTWSIVLRIERNDGPIQLTTLSSTIAIYKGYLTQNSIILKERELA